MDCRTEPEANVEAAIAQGLAGLTFTEHFDTHPDDWPGCVYNDEAYSAAIDAVREKSGGALFVGKGIEVCYQPARMDFILDFLRRHRFDMVMLSVHYFGAAAVHRRENWQGISAVEGTRRYLATVREAARFAAQLRRTHGRAFDVLGHLDVVKRYSKRFCDAVEVSAFPEMVDDILEACLEAELTPEINTSSWRQGVGESMPAPGTVQRYAQLGGKAMSLGSDAHRPEDIGSAFDRAVGMLREASIGNTLWFCERQAVAVPLP